MRGVLEGYYEAKIDGKEAGKKHHYRLFCLLERDQPGLSGPSIVVITGKRKPYLTVFSGAEELEVRALGDEYQAGTPRSLMA